MEQNSLPGLEPAQEPDTPPAVPPPTSRLDYSRAFFWILFLCLALGVAQFIVPPAALQQKSPEEGDMFWSNITGGFGPGITVIKAYGVIQTPEQESFYGEGGQDVAAMLHKIRKRDDIKGIVLRVNSPGGSVGASQEIHDEVKALVKLNKKVVVSMGDVAASGGYYISAPADYIFVNPGTITGSIGVITQSLYAKPLMEKIGVDFRTFKSGAFKDMGASNRELTEAEIAVFNSIIMGAYDQFVKAVAEGRVLEKDTEHRKRVLTSEEDVRKIADGRIYLGSQAVANGLADAEGSYYDALSYCGERAGLGKEPKIIKLRTMPPIPDLFQLSGAKASPADSLSRLAQGFLNRAHVPVLYLYQP